MKRALGVAALTGLIALGSTTGHAIAAPKCPKDGDVVKGCQVLRGTAFTTKNIGLYVRKSASLLIISPRCTDLPPPQLRFRIRALKALTDYQFNQVKDVANKNSPLPVTHTVKVRIKVRRKGVSVRGSVTVQTPEGRSPTGLVTQEAVNKTCSLDTTLKQTDSP